MEKEDKRRRDSTAVKKKIQQLESLLTTEPQSATPPSQSSSRPVRILQRVNSTQPQDPALREMARMEQVLSEDTDTPLGGKKADKEMQREHQRNLREDLCYYQKELEQ
ncbi:hypothetical protein NEUTE2DRAFT_125667 [Neurospora tetrasperma FGSC 2509]|nr:hypothetical protein NEUTE2DRAFT_125667 [Neurospora tetrasperma FGSC 2509]